MLKIYTFLKTLRRDEDGATAIEYALIAALLALVIIGGLSVAGTALNSAFSEVGSTISAN